MSDILGMDKEVEKKKGMEHFLGPLKSSKYENHELC